MVPGQALSKVGTRHREVLQATEKTQGTQTAGWTELRKSARNGLVTHLVQEDCTV